MLPSTALRGPVADGDQDDHRGDPDRHAEDRQARAELVRGDPPPGDAQRLARRSSRQRAPRVGADFWAARAVGSVEPSSRRSSTIRPSPSRMTRFARSATSGSWVTTTTVRPRRGGPRRCRSTSSVERRVEVPGRLVGEDQRRVRDDRARDRRLAAAGRLRAPRAGGGRGRTCRPPRARAAARRRRSIALEAGVGERQFDVGDRARAGHQVEALEDEPDLAVAQIGEVVLVEVAHVDTGFLKRSYLREAKAWSMSVHSSRGDTTTTTTSTMPPRATWWCNKHPAVSVPQ